MALISPTFLEISDHGDGSTLLVAWLNVTSATSDTCVPLQKPQYTNKSVHVNGMLGGATIYINGSNNSTSFASLNDPAGLVIAITAADTVSQIQQNTVQVQPVLSGGSGAVVNIYMLCVMPNPMRT